MKQQRTFSLQIATDSAAVRRRKEQVTLPFSPASLFCFLLLLVGASHHVAGFVTPPFPVSAGVYHPRHGSRKERLFIAVPFSYEKKNDFTKTLHHAFPTYINGDSATLQAETTPARSISRVTAAITKIGMISFIGLMCLLLPLTLLPQRLLFQLRIISRNRMNRWALLSSQWCARVAHRLIPFCRIDTIVTTHDDTSPQEPAIWVCNHISMLDVFILLIADRNLRGKHRRPIKIVYWKDLENNPVTKLLFRQAGFIPVNMAANAPGEDNEYDIKSFKKLLKDSKEAMADGFDLGILPEGQLNPHPERGILPIFTGAFTLAKFSKRKIGMLALHNVHKLWGATRGMEVLDRHVKVQLFGKQAYTSPEDFTRTFTETVGTFGKFGTNDRLDGNKRRKDPPSATPYSTPDDEDDAPSA